MSKYRNHVELGGKLWETPELTETTSGKPLLLLNVYIETGYRQYSRTDVIRVALFGDNAVSAADGLKRGDMVQVAGRLRTRGYAAAANGQQVQQCEVWATDWQRL